MTPPPGAPAEERGRWSKDMYRAHCEIKDPQEIRRILNQARIGRLATLGEDGYPYITPVNYVLLGKNIYFHSAPKGEKLENLAREVRVCFEVDIPLAYLEMAFNGRNDPCRVHQLYHSVLIRGRARVVPGGDLKTAALNALVAKHEGHAEFPPVSPEASAYKACAVIEIIPERISAKSDLLQNAPRDGARRAVAQRLLGRGEPGDLEAVRAMGYAVGGNAREGWHLVD